MYITLVEIEYTTKPRDNGWVDLYWKEQGWFHVYRYGEKLNVTCESKVCVAGADNVHVYREV